MEPTGRANARPMTGSAKSGNHATPAPDFAALHPGCDIASFLPVNGELRSPCRNDRECCPTNQTKNQPWRNAMSSPTHLNRRTLLTMLGGSVATPLLAPRIARSQEAWPARTVRYVNGFPAGGATDTLSRILCQKMSELSGQSFVVENRAGAGGVLGADAVAKRRRTDTRWVLAASPATCLRSEAMQNFPMIRA